MSPVLLDVTDPDSIAKAVDLVARETGGGLDALINNAGIAVSGPIEFLPIPELRKLLEVNVIGLVAVTQAALPLIRQSQGRVINMGSISGRIASPFIGGYAASKHALEGLSDALRVETAPWGVEVVLLEPGAIKTPIWDKGQEEFNLLEQRLGPVGQSLYGSAVRAFAKMVEVMIRRAESPEEVARVVEEALLAARPKTRYVIGRDASYRLIVKKLFSDRIFDRLMLAAIRRFSRER